MIKVAKFGGSSVANSTQLKKVKKIIESDKTRKFVVTSACGKTDRNDYKVTDLLYLCFAHIKYGVDYNEIFNMIEKKYKSIVKDLNIDINIDEEFDIIKEKIKSGIKEDFLVSRGEYLSAKILAKFLNYEFMDAKDFITFNFDYSIDLTKTKEKFDKIFDKEKSYVFPGFYGLMGLNEIKLMSRGGSDITGSIIANIIDADLYENWTDVSGIMVCDPNTVKNPKIISYISYEELREISYMGANVLNDEAIFPVKIKNIPINILNTNSPEDKGTMILADCSEEDKKNPPSIITGITGRKNFDIITVRKGNISNESGILFKALNIFNDYNLSIESAPASVDTFCIIIDSEKFEKFEYEIIAKLKNELSCSDIIITRNISLIAIVGRGHVAKTGMAGKIFTALGKSNINIRLINQGSDELSIIVGVENKDFEKAINSIYDEFIRK